MDKFKNRVLCIFSFIQLVIITWRAGRLLYWGFTDHILILPIESVIAAMIPAFAAAAINERRSIWFLPVFGFVSSIPLFFLIPMFLTPNFSDLSAGIIATMTGGTLLPIGLYRLTQHRGWPYVIGGITAVVFALSLALSYPINAFCGFVAASAALALIYWMMGMSELHKIGTIAVMFITLLWTFCLGYTMANTRISSKFVESGGAKYTIIYTDKNYYYCVKVEDEGALNRNYRLLLSPDGVEVHDVISVGDLKNSLMEQDSTQ